MTEQTHTQLDFQSDGYKTIRKSIATGSITTRGGDIIYEVGTLLENHEDLLNTSGETLLKQFETSWAGNDFTQASSLNLLQESIDLVRKATDDQKTPLQAFLGIAYMIVTNDVKMRAEMRDSWEKLSDKILTEEVNILEQGYEGSELSKIKPGDFNNVAIDGLAENLGDKFEKGKKIAWLLTK